MGEAVLDGEGTRGVDNEGAYAMSILDEIREICSRFPSDLPGRPSTSQEVDEAEVSLGFRLSDQYRAFLLGIGGACIGSRVAVGLQPVPSNGPSNDSVVQVTNDALEYYPWITRPCAVISIDGAGFPYVLLQDGSVAFCDLDERSVEIVHSSFDEWLARCVKEAKSTDDV